MLKRYGHIINEHRPKGYLLKRRKLGDLNGYAAFQREIVVDCSLDDRTALFIFLHECGHVHHQHLRQRHHEEVPDWQCEYEADQYAIKAMRAHKIPVPRAVLEGHKSELRALIDKAHEEVPKPVLRYAFGRHWRIAK